MLNNIFIFFPINSRKKEKDLTFFLSDWLFKNDFPSRNENSVLFYFKLLNHTVGSFPSPPPQYCLFKNSTFSHSHFKDWDCQGEKVISLSLLLLHTISKKHATVWTLQQEWAKDLITLQDEAILLNLLLSWCVRIKKPRTVRQLSWHCENCTFQNIWDWVNLSYILARSWRELDCFFRWKADNCILFKIKAGCGRHIQICKFLVSPSN